MRHLWVTNYCFYSSQTKYLCLILFLFATTFFNSILLAAPPAPFDAWASQNGRITAACPAGFTCDDNVVDAGILQRTLLDGNGRRYVHLILQDGVVAGDGRGILESYIDASSANRTGISARQSVVQSGAFNMNYNIDINTGWADSVGSPTIHVIQSLTDTTPEGVGFSQTFNLQQNQDGNENITGYKFGIRQEVTNSAILNGIASTGTDTHIFVLRRLGGDYVTAAGSASLPAAAGGMGMGGGGAAGGVAPPTPIAPAPVGAAPPAAGGGAAATPTPVATPAPAPAPPAAGGGQMGMSARTNTVAVGSIPSQSTNTIALVQPAALNSGIVRTFGTTSGAGASPCPTDGPPPGTGNGRTTGAPPICGTDPAPANPGSVGTGGGGLAAAPAGTLAPGPRTGAPGGLVGSPAGMGGGGPAGGAISWSAGQEIQVIWIGQVCQGCQTVAGMGGMGAGAGGSFSFQAYENLSSGAPAIVTRSILQSNPFNWAAPFDP